jgi:hypothetical protein
VGWLMTNPLARMNRIHDDSIFISHHMLRKPAELCIRNLPKAAKALVRRRYEDYLAGNPIASLANAAHAKEQLLSVLEFMESEDDIGSLTEKFIHETQKMDAYRGESFGRLDPELWAAIKT